MRAELETVAARVLAGKLQMLPAEESPLPREGGNRRAGAQMPVRLTEQVPETGRTVLSLLLGRGARLIDVAGLWCQRRAPGSESGGVYPLSVL